MAQFDLADSIPLYQHPVTSSIQISHPQHPDEHPEQYIPHSTARPIHDLFSMLKGALNAVLDLAPILSPQPQHHNHNHSSNPTSSATAETSRHFNVNHHQHNHHHQHQHQHHPIDNSNIQTNNNNNTNNDSTINVSGNATSNTNDGDDRGGRNTNESNLNILRNTQFNDTNSNSNSNSNNNSNDVNSTDNHTASNININLNTNNNVPPTPSPSPSSSVTRTNTSTTIVTTTTTMIPFGQVDYTHRSCVDFIRRLLGAPGATELRISALPVRALQPNEVMDGLAFGQDTCAICLDGYLVENRVRVLACKHVFHTTCIDPWLKRGRPTCPLCQTICC